MFQHAISLHQQGRLAEAASVYRKILEQDAKHAGALHLLGLIELQGGNPEAALAWIGQAIEIDPGNPGFLSSRGDAALGLGRFAEALASYDRVLAAQPGNFDVLYNRANALQGLGRFDEALAAYDRVLAFQPGDAEALHHRGDALCGLNRIDEALASYDAALAIQPHDPDALNSRGNALQTRKRYEEAIESYDGALAIEPGHAEALMNRGVALHALNRFEEALAGYDRALAIKPDYIAALINRGITLLDLKRSKDALADFDSALTIRSGDPVTLGNRGVALRTLKSFDAALDCFDRVLAVIPDDAGTLVNRADLLGELRRYEEASVALERVLLLDPSRKYARGQFRFFRMSSCDWTDFEAQAAVVETEVREGKHACAPFVFQAISSSPADLQTCSRIFAADVYPQAKVPLWRGERYGHEKIRLGYVSGEFREQATSYLAAGLFELHDKSRFELYAFDSGFDDRSPMRGRLETAFGRFHDISCLSDPAAARQVREHEIDILVNLNGYFGRERSGVFAHRPAPIQVNYLGFPATLGASYMDYIVADPVVIPENDQRYYDEKVAYLPDCYQANDAKRGIAARTPARAEMGLPDSGFVFCSFNVSYKFTPAMFDVWMRLLRAVEGSVLWLLEPNDAVAGNLRREAQSRGVAPERLVFAPIAKHEDYLARQRLGDLFLDTLPYNAHTTASDSLWAGLPVLTCMGSAFPGRVAASILRAIGLSELIAHNLADYEALALRLARDPGALAAIKAKLARNRLSTPLFDTDRFRRNIEAAYTAMYERHRRGEAPAGFRVTPAG